jgi:two-component system, NarL family, sensor histidine kinase UhpB
MALGHIALADVLAQLVRDRAREHPQISFSLAADGVARGYGDAADLTVYRCIQESLTNTIRHAQAEHVAVTLREAFSPETGARLTLTVEDDGTGLAPPFALGFGLRGMQERVQALGGELGIEATAPHGTCVQVTIPVEAVAAAAPASGDTVPA